MAYDKTKLSMWGQTIEGQVKEWIYISPDPLATILASGYISDGTDKRMLVGDIVWVLSGTLSTSALTLGQETFPGTVVGASPTFSASPVFQPCLCTAVVAATTTTPGAATLSAAQFPASGSTANFRNLLDGGDFTINPFQRDVAGIATSHFITTDITNTVTYLADRWFAVGGASSAIHYGKVANTDVAGYNQSLQWGRGSGTSNTAVIHLGQVLETADAIRAQGQFVTLSIKVKAGANFAAGAGTPAGGVTVKIVSGTGTNDTAANLVAGSWATSTNVISGTLTPTTTMADYFFTGTVSAAATQLGIDISYTPTGTAGANEWLQFLVMQLEIGGPTAYERRDVQVELEICQRYAWVVPEPTTAIAVGEGFQTTQTSFRAFLAAPVQFRTAPTVTLASGNFVVTGSGGVTVTVQGFFAATAHTVNQIQVGGTGMASISATASPVGVALQGSSGSGFIVASADF